jgi:hypothetical protein
LRVRNIIRALHLTAMLGVSPALMAQPVLTGVVREDSSTRALGGVEITVEGQSLKALTDTAGAYSFAVPNGVRIVIFRLPGYRPVRMRVSMKGDTVRADASLVRVQATQLDPVQVNAPTRTMGLGREGFADRRAMGFGKFVDSVALRAREDRRLSDVLRDLAGVRLIDYREPPSTIVEVRAVSPMSPMTRDYQVTTARGVVKVPGNPPCFVSVFFNGSTIYRSERATQSGKAPDFSRDFSVASLESIEYYRSGSEVPAEFGGANANCGALVLWSRR